MGEAKKPRASGARAMKAAGRQLVAVWLDANERQLIEVAAREAGMPVATWVRQQAYHAAQRREAARRRRDRL